MLILIFKLDGYREFCGDWRRLDGSSIHLGAWSEDSLRDCPHNHCFFRSRNNDDLLLIVDESGEFIYSQRSHRQFHFVCQKGC